MAYQVCHGPLQCFHTPAQITIAAHLNSFIVNYFVSLLQHMPYSSRFSSWQWDMFLIIESRTGLCSAGQGPLLFLSCQHQSYIKTSLSLCEQSDLIPTSQHFSLLLPFHQPKSTFGSTYIPFWRSLSEPKALQIPRYHCWLRLTTYHFTPLSGGQSRYCNTEHLDKTEITDKKGMLDGNIKGQVHISVEKEFHLLDFLSNRAILGI